MKGEIIRGVACLILIAGEKRPIFRHNHLYKTEVKKMQLDCLSENEIPTANRVQRSRLISLRDIFLLGASTLTTGLLLRLYQRRCY